MISRFLKSIKYYCIAGIIIVFLIFLLSQGHIYEKHEVEYGITFSKKHTQDLGLDWKQTYLALIDNLGVKKIRLSAYWNEVEPAQNEFNWQDLDWQVEEAAKKDVEIVLAIGGRLPRWPECHFPAWTQILSEDDREAEILDYVEKVIDKYKVNDKIVAWQIENEPFLSHFGECPELDAKFLDKEIALAKSLDQRPIIITDSGELSVWYPAASRADIFGTTMYLNTYSSFLEFYVRYPIKPGFFHFKKNLVKLFARPQKWIVIELQAEPWAPVPYQNVSWEERSRTMDLQKFKDILEFSRQAGFREFYLWGAEWWYWEKERNNRPEMWNEAMVLFNKDKVVGN